MKINHQVLLLVPSLLQGYQYQRQSPEYDYQIDKQSKHQA